MNTFRLAAGALALGLIGFGWQGTGRAAESYDNCTGYVDSLPATIGNQGTWCLRHNVSTAITSGAAITIATNNVTLDCNDFKIGGLGAGAGTGTTGIHADDRFNLKVRNCNIRGFLYGIYAEDGGGHAIEDNTMDGNTFTGIAVRGAAGSIVRGNIIVDTGGSTALPTAARGIIAEGGVNVIDNTVNGVIAYNATGVSYGIYTNNNGNAVVQGNRITGLAYDATRLAHGIFNLNSGRTANRDNIVIGPGSTGIRCTDNTGTSALNVVSGFNTNIDGCESLFDLVNGN